MDQGSSSKIRALALASRCLTREIRRLKDSPGILIHDEDATTEIDRLVTLARSILDPTIAKPETKFHRRREVALPPRAPLPRAAASLPGPVPLPAQTRDDLLDVDDDGPPSANHVLAILGRGTLVPIPELVGFLGTLGVTGVLKVATVREQFLVEFDIGNVCHAEGDRSLSGQRIGDILVLQGSIDRARLEAVLSSGPGWRLGRRLVEQGLITKAQLVRGLHAHIQVLFCRLFREEARNYTFWSGPTIWAEQGVRLNSTSLLLEGARVSDEVDDGLRTMGGTKLTDPS